VDGIGSRRKSGRAMKEDIITNAMKRSNQLQREMAFLKEMLIGKPTFAQE
jgi:hypothetical protein